MRVQKEYALVVIDVQFHKVIILIIITMGLFALHAIGKLIILHPGARIIAL